MIDNGYSRLLQIQGMVTTTSELVRMPNEKDPKIHESVFRAYNILEHTKTMLKRGDSVETILEIIQMMETTPDKRCDMAEASGSN